jgi:hypothetical protein
MQVYHYILIIEATFFHEINFPCYESKQWAILEHSKSGESECGKMDKMIMRKP